MNNKALPFTSLELIGDRDENFYQLGLRDKEDGKLVHRQVKSMLQTPFAPINKLIEEIGKQVIKNTMLKTPGKYPHLKAYAEGMSIACEELFYSMLIPELVSAMTKWAPGIMAGNLGCSSFFTLNQNSEIVHGRILDFPLQGSFDEFERGISMQMNGMTKTYSLSSSGIPYPSITCMTESGMTIALHQKFTNVFNRNGESIFEIIFEMINKVDNRKDVIEFLKSKQSLTTWCLYMGFKNGDILGYDIMGEDHFYNEYQVEENKIHYFCNHLENKNLNQKNFLPLGFHEYNIMREESAIKKINQFLKTKKKKNSQFNFEYELLKMMTTPSENLHPKEFFQMDCLTPSSITAVTMNLNAKKCYVVSGKAPKTFQNNIVEISNAFDHVKSQPLSNKKEVSHYCKEYHLGLHSLMKAQFGLDQKDAQKAYHEFQLAIDHLEHKDEKLIAEFYFLVTQYIYETHQKVLMQLLSDFKKIDGKLPPYLNDHCILFIARLEYILKLPITAQEDRIRNEKLKQILNFELKIPRAIFHLTNRLLIVPRVDILDIIYVYTH